MNRDEAKQILLLYRPGTRDAEQPEVIQAIEVARQDPELAKWFAQHQEFQAAMRSKLRQIPVPEHLKVALIADKTASIVRPSFWRQPPVWLAAAALFALLFGLSSVLLKPSIPDRFTNFRESMVDSAVRTYGMDLETNDLARLREFAASKGAPADYVLPRGLTTLQLKGGGLLRWRGNLVSMVCFDRGDSKMLFLFVMSRSAVKDPPSDATSKAQVARVDNLTTASWTQGDKAYMLAGPEDPQFAEKYAGP